jgi:superfamily II DNA or RNA helicase
VWAGRRRDAAFSWGTVVAAARTDPAARAVLAAHRRKRRIEELASEKLRALEELFCLHAGERVLVFAGSNEMVMAVSERFLVPSILGHTRRFERDEILRGFADGEFLAVVANRVLDEGVDVPAAKVAVVLGGLRSVRQATQRLGRVLRPQGAARAVLYEVVCEGTTEEGRSLARRSGDAYPRPRHRRV